METRTYNGHTYQRSNPNEDWKLAGGPQMPGVFTDPYRAKDEVRKDEDQGFQRQSNAIQQQNSNTSQANFARDQRKDDINNPQSLRQEYEKLPEIVNYRSGLSQVQKAISTSPNATGDLALTYAYAKAMDPTTGVRDAEQQSLYEAQPFFQSLVQRAKKQFGADGAGGFSPTARQQIRREIFSQVSSMKPLYDRARADLSDIAKKNGIDPSDVIGRNDTDVYAPNFRTYAEKEGDGDGVVYNLIGGDRIRPPEHQQAAGFGATTSNTPIPPEMQAEHDAYIAKNWGKIDPRDYAAFRVNLDGKYNFGSDPEAYAAAVPKLNQAAASGAGPNVVSSIPGVKKDMTGLDQFRNNVVSTDVGAGTAAALNSAGFGLPSLMARPQMDALRDAHPVSTFVGDIAGGAVGTGLMAKGLGAVAPTSRFLTNPLAADVAYGATTGATQANDPLYGAVTGGAAGFLGNKVGGAIGRAFPKTVGLGGALRDVDATVPTSEQLRANATDLYNAAEARGLTASGDDTLALADTTSDILRKEGRLGPDGRLTDTQPKTAETYKLIGSYGGEPMTPSQVQSVRGVVSDGLSSQEPAERRISRMLLDNFDNWTDSTNPELASGLRDARSVASRYLQGDEIARIRELGQVRTGQMANANSGAATRTDFRALDRGVINDRMNFAPSVEQAIIETSRGTPLANTMRNIGKYAPTNGVSSLGTLGLATAGGAAAGPLGVAGGLGLGATALGARGLSNAMTERSAQVAENLAYGGPEYEAVLNALLNQAEQRGGHAGAAAGSAGQRSVANLLGY